MAALVGLSAPAYAEETATSAPTETAAPAEGTQTPAESTQTPAPAESPASDPGTGSPAPARAPAAAPVAAATTVPAGATDLGLTLKGTTVAADAPDGKYLQVVVTNLGAATATGVDVWVDVVPGEGANRIEPVAVPEGCDSAEVGFSCAVGELRPGTKATIGVLYRPAPGAAANPQAGRVTARVTSTTADTNAGNDTVAGDLAIVPGGSDVLVVADDLVDVVPGETTTAAVAVLNLGAESTGPAEITVTMPTGVTLLERLPGCTNAADNRSFTCVYDSLGTGIDGIDLLAPDVKVDPSAGGPRTLPGGSAVLGSSGPVLLAQAGESRGVQRFRTAAMRKQTSAAAARALVGDADQSDNSDTFVAVTTAPQADLAVTTKKVEADGDTVTVPYTVANRGPSTATAVAVGITAPTGTTFASTPDGCEPVGDRRMLCPVTDALAPGASVAGRFTLRITGATVGTDGSIVVFADEEDPRGANDEVRILVRAEPALTQGRLPVTGTPWGTAAGSGAALLLLGGVLAAVARRRHATVAVEND